MINKIIERIVPTSIIRYRLPISDKKIALTFDDGPCAGRTDRVLKVLREANQRATFFILGKKAEKFPGLLKEMVNQDCEIGNHSYSHPFFSKIPYDQFPNEIDQTDDIIQSIVGTPPKNFRPPYGDLSFSLVRYLFKKNRPITLWSQELGGDGTVFDRSSELIVEDINNCSIRNGDIILMHDTSENSVNALSAIVNFFSNNDFELVTLTELLK